MYKKKKNCNKNQFHSGQTTIRLTQKVLSSFSNDSVHNYSNVQKPNKGCTFGKFTLDVLLSLQ